MRISDWSSDVCSSDLRVRSRLRTGDAKEHRYIDGSCDAAGKQDPPTRDVRRRDGPKEAGQKTYKQIAVLHPCRNIDGNRREVHLRLGGGAANESRLLARRLQCVEGTHQLLQSTRCGLFG